MVSDLQRGWWPVADSRVMVSDLQRGWWRVPDSQRLRAVLDALNMRGLRERALQRNISRVIDSLTAQQFSGKIPEGM